MAEWFRWRNYSLCESFGQRIIRPRPKACQKPQLGTELGQKRLKSFAERMIRQANERLTPADGQYD